jgi:hypothetical protein
VACTTTPSGSYAYTKIGSIVTMRLTAAVSCTGDSNGFQLDAGTLPVALRPASIRCAVGWLNATDNSVYTQASVTVNTDGSLSYVAANTSAACAVTSSSWTASGGRGLLPHTFTYSVN